MLPKVNLIENRIIKWVAYTKNENICNRYPLDLWHLAVHDIDSDEEWADFLSKSNAVKCYVLKMRSNEESIAFVYIMQEDFEGKVVSIHGGGWKNPMLYYRGYVLMLKHLLDNNIKVRTSCQLLNKAAIRFSRSVGFVPYRYTEDEVFMWISTQRLTGSKLYKRFYNDNSSD